MTICLVLREEIETAMRLLGVTSLGQLNTSHVNNLLFRLYSLSPGVANNYSKVNTRALDAAIYHDGVDIHGLSSKL